MTEPGRRDGYVSSDGLTRAERRRQTEQGARRAKGDRSGPDRAADMARAATAMARSRRGPRRAAEPVARQRVHRATFPRDRNRPLYARLLRLRHLRPGGLACFLLFEGVIALAVLLSLAELVGWFSVIVLPAVVAAIVKINDIIAGAFAPADAARLRRGSARPPRVRGVAKVRGATSAPPIMPDPGDTTGTVDVTAPDHDPQITRQMTRLSDSPSGRRRQSNQRRFPAVEPPSGRW